MFALLTLPRGVPIDPEPPEPAAREWSEAPVGIIIRPGPAPAGARPTLRRALSAARG